MRGNYEPPELLWGQHLISSSSWHQVPACPACLPSSLVVPSSTSTIKDVSSSHFLLFATKSEIKLSFHVFNKALCWISTSQKRAKLWQSSICKVRRTSFQDQNIPIVGIAEWHCWKRDAVTKKSNPAFSSNSQSVQCILAQISLYVLHPAHISSSTAFTSKTKQCPSMQTISDHEQCMYIHNTHSRAICVRRTWMGPTT